MGRRTLGVLLALLAGVVVCLAVAAVMLGLRAADDTRREAQRAAAVQAARQEMVNLMTVDYRTVDSAIARILQGATGSFKDDFAANSAKFVDTVTKAESTSQATVQASGVVSFSDTSAQVLVALDSVVKSPDKPQGVLNHTRWQVTVDKVGNRWLVSKLEPM